MSDTVLVTGASGSGKSTALAGLLSQLDATGVPFAVVELLMTGGSVGAMIDTVTKLTEPSLERVIVPR